jgi:large subunit ribosomal protein L30
MAGTVRITLKKSPIGSNKRQLANLNGLGLRRMNQSVEREDTPQVRGMVRKVAHLVEVEEQA